MGSPILSSSEWRLRHYLRPVHQPPVTLHLAVVADPADSAGFAVDSAGAVETVVAVVREQRSDKKQGKEAQAKQISDEFLVHLAGFSYVDSL